MMALNHIVILVALLKVGFLPAQVAISVDRMNVLYSGLENPLTVVVSDIPDSNLLLIPSMGEIKPTSAGRYSWTICHRDTNFATLTIQDLQGDSILSSHFFRVNRLPTPTPFLGSKYKSKKISPGEYCVNGGIALVLENFDFDLKCTMLYFDVQYLPRRADGIVLRNTGARWSSEVQEQINKAKTGDIYLFYNFAYRCGCDPMVHHDSETLSFKIK